MANSFKYRKTKKYFFIYKTTNLLNGKYYIGMHCTNNLKDGYLGSGTRLRRSIRKYGVQNFKLEILEYCKTYDELKQREKQIVNVDLLKDNLCMNLKPGGDGGLNNEAHKKKFVMAGSKAANIKLKWLWENDKEWADKVRKRNALKNPKGIGFVNWTGRKHKPETIELMKRSKNVGKQNSQYGTMWITNGTENKKIKKDDYWVYDALGWYKGRI